MLYIQESLENVNIERAEYAELATLRVVSLNRSKPLHLREPVFHVPIQRASDIIEIQDSVPTRSWISRNGLTLITTSAAQAIYDAHVADGDEEARTLS